MEATPLQDDIIHFMMKEKADDETAEEFYLEMKKIFDTRKKEKEKIYYLSHIAATIQPDPIRAKICRSGCLGRGYRYIDVSLIKGEVHYKIDLCCGVVGASPYAHLIDRMMQNNKKIDDVFSAIGNGFQGTNKMLEQHDSDTTAGIKALEVCVAEDFEELKKYQWVRKLVFWKHQK